MARSHPPRRPHGGPATRLRRRMPPLALLLLAAQAPAPPDGATGAAGGSAAAAAPVAAEAPIGVRTGTHPGFGRIVFDAPARTRYRLVREGERVSVQFPDTLSLGRPQPAPRNVSGLTTSGSRAEFVIARGSVIREMRLGERIVLDVLDPADPAGVNGAPRGPAPRPPAAPTAPVEQPQAPPRTAVRGSPTTASPAAPSARAGDVDGSRPPPARDTGTGSVPARPAEPAAAAAPLSTPPPGSPPLASQPGGGPGPAVPPSADGPPPPEAPSLPTTPAGPVAQPAAAVAVATLREETGPGSPAGHSNRADPEVDSPAGPHRAAAQAAAPPVPAVAQPSAAPPAPRPAAPAADLPGPAATQPVPDPAPAGPLALLARRLTPPNAETPAFLLPFGEAIGAALFERETGAVAVFGERRPIDLSPLRDDPVLGSASIQLLPSATTLHLRLPPGRTITLSPTPQGWRVALPATATPRPALRPVFAAGRVTLPVMAGGGVVTLRDPDSDATLLVGLVGRGAEAVTTERRTTEFTLLVTLRGILIEPLADTVALRGTPGGFALTGGADGLALSPPSSMTGGLIAAARLTRRFRFPAMPVAGLAERVRAHVQQAAAMAPLARGPARKVAAETMIALGMAAEAEALLQVMAEQDPKEAAAPDTVLLRAIAALLAGRLQEAQALADPRLATTDEDALWRAALLATRQEGSPEAAQLFAVTAPLALTYPPALRDRLLPLALETMILGGARGAAEEILAERPDDPALRLARAMAAQARGETDAALALLDALANDRDQLVRARAAVRAVELRLAAGRLSATAAADALDRLLYAWRGDGRDLALRRRIAELRQHGGAWRSALTILREALAAFPTHAELIRGWQQSMFAELVHGDDMDRIDALDLVALVEENADLLPATVEGDRLRDRLADRLVALELPRRAEPVLARLLQSAPTAAGRAGYGTRLARLRLPEGDAQGALAALGQSSDPDLPVAAKEQRLLLAAAALGRLGNTKAALDALAGLDGAAAEEARAAIQEQAGDWAGAKRALTGLARQSVPETGTLDDAQRRILMRLATAAARAGDEALLTRLRERDSERMGTGPLGEMFRLLTAGPVHDAAATRPSGQEIGLARVPAESSAGRPGLP